MKKKFLISFVFALAVLSLLQIPNRQKLGDPDGFYHAKASQILAQGNLTDSFPHLTYTTWKDGYADQHYLYHALLIPFSDIDNLYLSIITFSLLAVFAFYFLFIKLDIKGKWFWVAILLLGSTDFLFRINLVKANTLSLVLLAISIFLLWKWKQKTNKWVAVGLATVSFLFVWTYGGFVFLPVVVGLYMLSVLVIERKFDYIPMLVVGAGITLGLLVHPHNSHLLVLLYDQIFKTGFGAGSEVPAGNEWLAFNGDWFLSSNIPVLLAWVLGLIASIAQLWRKKISWLDFWLQSLVLALLVLTLRHRRFIEYFTPFAVLAAASALSPYFAKISWAQIKHAAKMHWQLGFAFVAIVLIIASASFYNFKQVYEYLQNGEPIHRFEDLGQVVMDWGKDGDIVINTQWDQFPQLFYWNSESYYPVGLDPTFMYIYDKNLYWDWRKIADDNTNDWGSIEELHDLASKNLKAKFIFIDGNRNFSLHEYIQAKDRRSKFFRLIYDHDNSIVYRILP